MLQYKLNRQCWFEMKQNKQSCFRRRADDVTEPGSGAGGG